MFPSLLGALWGAGVYGLSEAGRSRFGAFPDLIADDLWVDRQFAPDEIEIVDCAPVVVAVPRRVRDLMLVLRRWYRGNAETAAVDPHEPRRARRRRPRCGSCAGSPCERLDRRARRCGFVGFAASARLAVAAPLRGLRWERDDSSQRRRSLT